MRTGNSDRGALVEPHRRIGLVDRAAMAVDRAVIFTFLQAAIEVRRQRHAGIDAATLEHLDQHRAHRRPSRAEADNVYSEALAFGIGPEPVAALFETLGREQRV